GAGLAAAALRIGAVARAREKHHVVADRHVIADADRIFELEITAHVEATISTDAESRADVTAAAEPRHAPKHRRRADAHAAQLQRARGEPARHERRPFGEQRLREIDAARAAEH